jgi:hypothetical protein
MSVKLVEEVKLYSRATAGPFELLKEYADRATDGERLVFQKHKRTAGRMRIGIRSVERHVATLLAEPLEELELVDPRTWRGRPATYRIVDLVAKYDGKPAIDDGKPATTSTKGRQLPLVKAASGGGAGTTANEPANKPPDPPSRRPADTELFDAMRSRLAAFVASPFIAHTMVDPLELLGRRGDVLEVLAPSHSILRIRRTYGPLLEDYARELSGERLRVHVIGEHELGRRTA